MALICLSYSHQHTPIAFRERIYFDQSAVANACARFRCGDDDPSPFLELAVLSTCNRTEIYAYCDPRTRPNSPADARHEIGLMGDGCRKDESHELADDQRQLLDFIHESRNVDRESLISMARWHRGPQVFEHLARVAAGLESIVLGEPQILGQVGDAMRMGLVMNSAGPVLTKLFQSAITCGRRSRTETSIGEHSCNISTLAVNAAEKQLGSLKSKTVVLLGAGDMADLALMQLNKRDVQRIYVVNRTLSKARELADKYGGAAFVYEQLTEVLPWADLLITSTGAPHTLVTRDMIADMMRVRQDRSLAILDIAVPRDVEMTVDAIANVWRMDIDDLQMAAGESVRFRKSSIPQVSKIIDHETDRFLAWIRGVGIERTIAALRKKTDQIRRTELDRLLLLLGVLEPEQQQVIEQFSRSLTNKLLHDPTTKLRRIDGTRMAVDHGETIRELFALDTESHALPEDVVAHSLSRRV